MMGMVDTAVPESTDLHLGAVVLERDLHYQMTTDGIVLLKSGHQRIHLHVTRSINPQEEASMILHRVLHDPAFCESTFEAKFRPTSIFRGLSRRPLVTVSYLEILRLNLELEDARIVRRSARILAHTLKSAAEYPDLRTLLHCYFRADWAAPYLFTTFVRNHLRKAKVEPELTTEWNALRRELDRFAEDLRPQVATIGSHRTSSEEVFTKSIEDLIHRLEGQRVHRLAEL
jgi:hypothetical protein